MRKIIEKAAEYLNRDPGVALQQLRLLAEKITLDTAANCHLPLRERQDFLHRLRELEACDCIPSNIARSLHKVRRAGNKAAHPIETVTPSEAEEALGLALTALEWYEEEFSVAAHKNFEQFREDIKVRTVTTANATKPNRSFESGGPTSVSPVQPSASQPSDALHSPQWNEPTELGTNSAEDWITGARHKSERFLEMAENGARSVNSWATPRLRTLTAKLRLETSSALRSLSKALEDLATKRDKT